MIYEERPFHFAPLLNLYTVYDYEYNHECACACLFHSSRNYFAFIILLFVCCCFFYILYSVLHIRLSPCNVTALWPRSLDEKPKQLLSYTQYRNILDSSRYYRGGKNRGGKGGWEDRLSKTQINVTIVISVKFPFRNYTCTFMCTY